MNNRGSFYITFCVFSAILLSGLAFGQKHYKDLHYPEVGQLKMPEYDVVTLDNGMKVILIEDHELPFIKMRAELYAGSVWGEPDDKVGLGSITGQVMRTGGSENIAGDQVDEELESIAASVETWISDVWGGASVSTLKDHFDKVAGIFADIMMHPAFPEDKIELAKVQARSGISRRNDDVSEIAEREFNQLIYANSAFWRDEEYATIDAITRDDLIAFHKKWVRPNGMVLGVWGDFNKKEMKKKIATLFKDWKPVGESKIIPPKVDYQLAYGVNFVEKKDVNQSNIYIGHIGGQKDNPDYPALIMMNEVLSGGFSSRLFSRVRSDQGLAYAVYGAYGTNFFHPGAFFMYSGTKSERTVEAVRSMLKEMRLMSEELVGEEELHLAKEGWLNSYVFNFDSMDKIAQRLVQYAYNGYPMDFLQKTRDGVEQVTREDILRAAKKYLHPDEVQVLVVGNPDDFDEPLSVLGEVNTIDIAIPAPKAEMPEATTEGAAKGKAFIAKMAEKIGGMDKVLSVRNSRAKAKMTQVTPMGSMEMEGVRTLVLPDKLHLALNTPQGAVNIVLAGDEAWMETPQGKMPAPDIIKNNLKAEIFHDPIALLQLLDDVTVQYVGEGTFNETATDELVVAMGDESYHLYLDKVTGLPAGIKYNTIGQQGPAEIEEFYSDYRDAGGIKSAFKAVAMQDGEKASESEMSEMSFNVEPDMSLFEK